MRRFWERRVEYVDAETLVELTDIPELDAGAPCPLVLANEHQVLVAYHLSSELEAKTEKNICGVVQFDGVDSHLFGSPNDEALHGHRLSKHGLQPYSFYRVNSSVWIAELCARNRVHRYHQDRRYAELHHFIFTFHDTTFEIVARSYRASIEDGDPIDCVGRRLLDRMIPWS